MKILLQNTPSLIVPRQRLAEWMRIRSKKCLSASTNCW